MADVFTRIFKTPAFALICLSLVGIAILTVWKVHFSPDKTERALRLLDKAYASARPTEARISGLSYAGFTDARGTNHGQINQIELKKAETILLESDENPTGENSRFLGRVFLARRNFDAAIEQFEKALKLTSDDAEIHNDLGAAREHRFC